MDKEKKRYRAYANNGHLTQYEEVTGEEWDKLGEMSRGILAGKVGVHGAILVKVIGEVGSNY